MVSRKRDNPREVGKDLFQDSVLFHRYVLWTVWTGSPNHQTAIQSQESRARICKPRTGRPQSFILWAQPYTFFKKNVFIMNEQCVLTHLLQCHIFWVFFFVLDVNECEVGNHTCNVQQTCFNVQGGFKCLDPVRCEDPYIRINEKWVIY